jgi:lipopolysaccharide transport protein LptA
MTRINKFCFNLGITLVILAQCDGYALATDDQQSITMKADKVEMNYETGTSVFTGNASATQGSSRITGIKIITHSADAKTITKIVSFGTPEKLATYQTTLKQGANEFNSKAEKITYSTNNKIAALEGNAYATHVDDTFSGPNVTYDAIRHVVSTSQSESGPSTIVFNPS